ncbi:MAG: LysM peptidoglycan-binding domain-containing protein [Chloroflexi bacterium]|nr:LysM peptidoglycan-binding domain-containing protein [Chloroflexota bacterium]
MIVYLLLAGCGSEEDTAVIPTQIPTPTATPRIGVSLATRAVPTAAVLQTTPIPLPTATVTPTPTPIVHVVQSGETLLGIAIEKGTTTEDIAALNPEMNPSFLLIGQEIVLPPPAAAVTQLDSGTAVPLHIAVTQIQTYQTPVGSVWLLGELVNEGEQPVENVQVSIRLLDEIGAEVGTAAAWAALPIILSGQAVPFGVLLNEPPQFAHETVFVSGGQMVMDVGTRYLDMTAAYDLTLNAGTALLRGDVQNVGEDTAVQPTLIAAFYDAQKQIIGFAQHTLPDAVPPDESVPFEFETTPPGGTVAAVEVFVIASRMRIIDN